MQCGIVVFVQVGLAIESKTMIQDVLKMIKGKRKNINAGYRIVEVWLMCKEREGCAAKLGRARVTSWLGRARVDTRVFKAAPPERWIMYLRRIGIRVLCEQTTGCASVCSKRFGTGIGQIELAPIIVHDAECV